MKVPKMVNFKLPKLVKLSLTSLLKSAKIISKSAENIDIQKIGESASNASKKVQKMVLGVSYKEKEGVIKSAEVVNKVMDINGDGQVDIEDVIIMGLRIPWIFISREEFLQCEFMKDYPQEIIEDAIAFNPAHAEISYEKIKKYADEVIKFERNLIRKH